MARKEEITFSLFLVLKILKMNYLGFAKQDPLNAWTLSGFFYAEIIKV